MNTTAPEAELAVLGSLMLQPDLASTVMEKLTPADFVLNERAAAVLWALLSAGSRVDPVIYRDALLERQALPRERVSVFITQLHDAAWSPMSVGAYADTVIRATRRRGLARAAGMLTQGVADGDDIDSLCTTAIEAVERVLTDTTVDDQPSMTLEQLLDTPTEYDWVIPGLLERTDRFIVSAGEGSGKSTLLRMVALCAACGVHPFTLERIRPMKVLMVDCENSRKQSARKFRGMVEQMRESGYDPGNNLAYQSRPEGLDLASPSDAAWLLNRVQVDQPGLLTIGPAYRLCTTVSDDDVVGRVLGALDAARLRVQCALMLEAHPGQGQQWSKERDLRPKGSQLWRAWPESIRGLRRDPEDERLGFLEFAGRGDRDQRFWPQAIREGYSDELPWVAMTPEDADAKRSLRSVS